MRHPAGLRRRPEAVFPSRSDNATAVGAAAGRRWRAQRVMACACLAFTVSIRAAKGAHPAGQSADGSCAVAVTVVRDAGPPYPWPGFPRPLPAGKFYPPTIVAAVPGLPPESFSAYEKVRHGWHPIGVLSAEEDSGGHRIVLVVGHATADDRRQPMLGAVPAAIERILAKARAQDSFALLIAGDGPIQLGFGSGRDAVWAATERIRNRTEWGDQRTAIVDALLEAVSWFRSPQLGDSIILFGALPHEPRGRISRLRASLTTAHARLLVFSASDLVTTGGDLVSGTWVSPLAQLIAESGGGAQAVGYIPTKRADDYLWLWQAEAESVYAMTSSVYILRVQRTGGDIVIDLSPQFREELPRAVVMHPRPLLDCR